MEEKYIEWLKKNPGKSYDDYLNMKNSESNVNDSEEKYIEWLKKNPDKSYDDYLNMKNSESNVNDSEEISINELNDLRRNLELQNQSLLESLARRDRMGMEDRYLRVQKIRNDISDERRKAAFNATVCGASALIFMSFASVACQKLGVPNMMMDIQSNIQNNLSSMTKPVNESIVQNMNFIMEYCRTVFGQINQYLTLDNIKSFVSETGPVGTLAGLMTAFSSNKVFKNLKELYQKNRELDTFRQVIPESLDQSRKAMGEFSLYLTKVSIQNSINNKFSACVNFCRNAFAKKQPNIENENISAMSQLNVKDISLLDQNLTVGRRM